ncbi:SA1362 family protein [Sutcliffiella rhizosphaerae]|uniref:Uncharacterized protein n=1 Tax=Sutcliffiella rhizosphaerae TaxID=2880967 RepID=A0ABM8YHQ2_9BACI|nr:SA1362 family protein [Sutcliffiella rhizosphaerae]CAG9619240.1 hypothetical protein BACCIP111883_00007 [Sutcliffiella rhizosphaerae]
MKGSFRKPIFYTLISLAAFALIVNLFENPGGLFRSILLIIGGVTVFYLIFRHFIQGRLGGGTDSRYNKAVKQSKKRYGSTGSTSSSSASNSSVSPITNKDRAKSKPAVPKRKAPTHLTVIDGKKGKKKNRAFF